MRPGRETVVVTCDSCNRQFHLDERKVTNKSAARCLCGVRVAFHPEAGGNKNGAHRLGKYILLRRIAVGGMGEIFYGKIAGIEGFEREVAIKKMLPHLSEDRAFIEMMIKEAKLTVLLHHPNIVQVYDLAMDGKDYFIAMEYVPGVTVGHLLELSHRSGTLLPVEAAVHMTMQVLRGLAYAHDLRSPEGEPMNLLHRDITPQNILVTRSAWVKITDFGIAKARNEISTTSPGMIKGKLGYIAPEQLTGSNPDQRIDIFCAGILLWESLAARRLFKGVDEIDTFRLISEAYIPPLRDHRDDVMPELEEAMQGALAQDPEKRYTTADEFYDALNQAIFPNTADDYASTTKRYFSDNPHFFADVATLATEALNLENMNHATGEKLTSGGVDEQPLTEISLYVVQEKKEHSALPIVAVAATVLAVLGLTGIIFKDKIQDRLGIKNEKVIADPATADSATASNKLTLEEVQRAVDGERSRLVACYRFGQRRFRKISVLEATLVIPSTGGVSNLTTSPNAQKLGRPGPCIVDVLRSLKFRPHPDPVFEAEVKLPSPKTSTKLLVVSSGGSRNSGDSSGGTRSGGGVGTLAAEIQGTLRKSSAALTKCLGGLAGVANAPDLVNATITISTSGKVTQVSFSPTVPVVAVEKCLRRNLMSNRFHNKPPNVVKVTIPLKIQLL